MLFGDFNSKVTGFESHSDTKKLVNSSSSMTVDLKTCNQETQTTTTQSTGSQTFHKNDHLSNAENPPYDADKLLKFLNRVLPHLEDELKISDINNDLNFSHNHEEFESFHYEGQEKPEQSSMQAVLKPEFCKDKTISSLSWNSTDMMLAIAYLEKSHRGWCCHETSVGLYNTGKFQFDKSPPSRVLKVPSCVRCIKFHDYIPSLLAGGLYSGEVIMWDLKHDEESPVVNKKNFGDEPAHVDVITYLTWREDENSLKLITAGRDGRIIVWKVTVTNLSYEVYQRHLILKQHIVTTAAPNEHLEIIHIDFQSIQGPYFVAACDGGTLFYCSLKTAKPLTSFLGYQNPILRTYKSRKGIITHVSCSSDLFASSGTDSEIHIFKYEQESPLLKIYTSYVTLGVLWNSSDELISWGNMAVESHKIHDAGVTTTICEFEGLISAVAVKIASNRRSKKFAIGNQKGDILVLRDWISMRQDNF